MRLFFSIPLTPQIHQSIEKHFSLIKSLFPGGKWVLPHNRHITLLFLGDFNAEDVDTLCAQTQESLPNYQASELNINRLDAFPHRLNVKTLFYTVSPSPALEDIGRCLRSIASNYGIKEQQRFFPHITLARFHQALSLSKEHPWDSLCLNESQVFDRFDLVSSSLKATGPLYTSVATFTFPKEDQYGRKG